MYIVISFVLKIKLHLICVHFWKHLTQSLMLSSVSWCLAPVMKHKARVFDILHEHSTVDGHSIFHDRPIILVGEELELFQIQSISACNIIRVKWRATCIQKFQECLIIFIWVTKRHFLNMVDTYYSLLSRFIKIAFRHVLLVYFYSNFTVVQRYNNDSFKCIFVSMPVGKFLGISKQFKPFSGVFFWKLNVWQRNL